MGFKPVGVDDSTSLFPPRVMNALRALFGQNASLANSARKAGSIVGFGGDSHTAGTGATNAFYGFKNRTAEMAGWLVVSPNSINGGVGGENSAQLLARIPAMIASGIQTLFVLIGTNDAGQGISVSTYAANIQAMKALADTAGISFVIATIPPRASGASADSILKTNSYNMWLRTWAATNNVPIADFWTGLVDTTTGLLSATYNSGDGTHVNNDGHIVMGKLLSSLLKTVIPTPVWPITSAGLGMTNDPLGTDSTPWNSARWDILSGYFGGLSVTPQTADTSGFFLPAGRWIRFQNDNATGSVQYSKWRKQVDLTKCSPGDKLLFLMYIKSSEPMAINKVELRDASNSLGLYLDGIMIQNPGPFAAPYTVPATKPSELQLSFTQAAPGNRSSWVDIGVADVINLTTLGVNINGL